MSPSVFVAGPPCSGKTTFVRGHAPVGFQILDFDDIVEDLGHHRYEAPPAAIREAALRWNGSLDVADWVIWTAWIPAIQRWFRDWEPSRRSLETIVRTDE